MSLKLKVLDEPQLEFGKGNHICPKAGIETLGVYDSQDELRQDELRIGIIGRGEGVDLADVWLERCRNGIASKESKHTNLFRGFRGFSKNSGFLSRFVHGPAFTRTIQRTELNKAFRIKNKEDRIDKCVELFYEQIRFLAENRNIDVILCVIPDEMYNAVNENASLVLSGNDNDEDFEQPKIEYNFRRLLKAKSMHLRVPLQLVLEKSITAGKTSQGQQDDATKAWNFCTALYYKGNRTIPWRLVEESYKPKTCYVGVGFYKSRDKKIVSTSLAQLFDEFGHGVILRGTPVSVDKDDRRPYMNKQQAFDLLVQALEEYDHALQQMPARVVIHKTSNFKDSELTGFSEALIAKGIRTKDFVTVMDSKVRLYSYETYPPKRGTLFSLDEDKGILYTRGFVDFYKTYPGMYVPSPLEIRLFEHDSSLEDVAKEILGLSKMNWNNTQLDGKLPITLECAKRVGEIMKYVNEQEKPQVSYSFYM